eukprot:1193468-Prorocentrum_minimum.AAC.3
MVNLRTSHAYATMVNLRTSHARYCGANSSYEAVSVYTRGPETGPETLDIAVKDSHLRDHVENLRHPRKVVGSVLRLLCEWPLLTLEVPIM